MIRYTGSNPVLTTRMLIRAVYATTTFAKVNTHSAVVVLMVLAYVASNHEVSVRIRSIAQELQNSYKGITLAYHVSDEGSSPSFCSNWGYRINGNYAGFATLIFRIVPGAPQKIRGHMFQGKATDICNVRVVGSIPIDSTKNSS